MTRHRRLAIGFFVALMGVTPIFAVSEAPIGQMYSHTHHHESWMVSLESMYTSADGLRHGGSPLSNDTVLEHFNHSPISMHMSMTMLDIMKAVNDKVTVMVMVPYVLHSMDVQTPSGDIHSHSSAGIGDITVTSLYTAFKDSESEMIWITGFTLPAGSIDEKDDDKNRLGYPMQLGSGTLDLQTGFTLNQFHEDTNYGVHVLGTFRTGMSKNGYRLGNKVEASTWMGHEILPSLKGTLKLAFSGWTNIIGEDEELDPVHSGIYSHHKHSDPLNTTQTGGSKLDLSIGLNKAMSRFTLGVEAGVPIYQRYPGYVMNQTWWSTIGIHMAF